MEKREEKIRFAIETLEERIAPSNGNFPPGQFPSGNPAQAPGPVRELTTLVHLGVQCALEAGFTHPLEPWQMRVPREPLLRSLGMDEEVIAPIVAGLSERVLLVTEAA